MEAANPAAALGLAEMCTSCGAEFMIRAQFCHACGGRRPVLNSGIGADASARAGFWEQSWTQKMASLRVAVAGISWRKISFPGWLHYLHFHEIQRSVGLPTASLIAFFIGLGCVAGAIGVSVFYRASNLSEFQAIQMWRMEWLLAATASFVAGILLKKPSGDDNE